MTTATATKIPDHYRPAPSLKANDLAWAINKAIKEINNYVEENNLTIIDKKGNQFFGKLTEESFENNLSINSLESSIAKMTKSSKKKLAKRIRIINQKMSILSFNSFFSFLRNKITNFDLLEYIKISPSQEEQEIILARNKYKDLKSQLILAHKNYKDKKKVYHTQGKKYLA